MVSSRLVLAVVSLCASAAGAESNAVIVVYDGWGTDRSFVVEGRVLEELPSAPVSHASKTDNILDTLKALESDEIVGAEVMVSIGSGEHRVVRRAVTDEDGNFLVAVKDLPEKQRLPRTKVSVEVTLVGPADRVASPGIGNIFVIDAEEAFVAVVSDVDDTVVKTHVTDKKKMLGAVLLKNATQLDPVEGAALNYQSAHTAGARAFFYLSGSPQNFYARIKTYLGKHAFPPGPLLLKNFGSDSLLEQQGYKLKRLEGLASMFPKMRMILVGDSGEKDPEIYAEMKKRYPERVKGIVIRTTPSSDVRPERFFGMTVVEEKYTGADVISRLLRAP